MSEFNHPTMITPLQTGKNFWSTGKSNSRRTAAGATAIFVILALICAVVWLSPTDSIVRKVAADVVKPIATNVQLKNDRANLLSQLVSQKTAMSTQSAKMADQTKELNAALGKAKALEAELSAAKKSGSISAGQAASYKAQLTKLEASLAASGGSAAVAGGSTSGADTTTTPSTGTSTTPTTPTGPVTITTPTLAEIKDPTSRYFGLYTDQSPFNFADSDAVATDVDAEPNVSGYFQGFDTAFRADAVQKAWSKGQLPMMTWETQPSSGTPTATQLSAYSLGNIIDGKFDAYLTAYAKAIVANGQPMAIRLDQEMNANWYPWGEGTNGNSAGQFVEMWQHVHDIFQAQGANAYVVWDWSPNRVDAINVTNGKTEAYLKSFYPGDDYVDWVGMSAYLRPPYSSSETYSFDHTFGLTLQQLTDIAPNKKIILSEIGASEIGGQKAKWITDLFQNLSLPANDNIIGFVWFNHTVTSSTNGVQYTNDWRVQSSPSSIAAFAAGIARKDIDYDLTAP